MSIVLLLGSGPNVVTCRDWPRDPFDQIVAINNAWQVRPDWTYLIHPDDFAQDRMPLKPGADQRIVTSAEYVPAQNELGGFVYAGGTMAFTAGYWALARLQPRVIAMLGCDMVYPAGQATHFYGRGAADPGLGRRRNGQRRRGGAHQNWRGPLRRRPRPPHVSRSHVSRHRRQRCKRARRLP